MRSVKALFFFLFFPFAFVYGQTEYIVTLDPSNFNFPKADSLTAYPQDSDEPLIFGKMLTELKEPRKPEWPLAKDLKISPVALPGPFDTTYNWKLLYYQKLGRTEIIGQGASNYEKTYINTKPEMRFSSALLKKIFQLSEPSTNWKIRQQPSASGSIYLIISSYRGNPNANTTVWEEEEFYVFVEYGLYEEHTFQLNHLLEESADPTPFEDKRSVTGKIVILKPYAVADTGKWQLLGYEEWDWQDILGRDTHVTGYRKYTAKNASVFSGTELRKEFKLAGPEMSRVLRSSGMNWQSYILDNGIIVIEMSMYQPGNMTNWSNTFSYYFKKVR